LWIGTYRGGLNRMNRERGTFERFRSDPEDPAALSDDRVMVIRSDSDGMLWIGTEDGGLNRFDPRTRIFTRFRSDPAEPSSLGSNFIWSMHEGRDGTLWIGAQGGGLHRWSQEDRRALRSHFTRYTERDGLRNESIYGILEDAQGNLWLSTNRGVSRFDPQLERFTNFDTTHGLQNNEFNFGASFAGPTGEMLFGGNNGFNVFDPVRVDGNDYVPPVVLTGIFKLNERVVLDKPTPEAERITLGHLDHTVSFEFAALDFTAPQRNRYAYKLDGFDQDWVQLGNSRRATYTSLPPGSYVFRVRGTNNDEIWNETGAQLAVEVFPPPWKTWWAYSLYALVLFGVVLRYTHIQAEKLRREAEYSRKLEEEVRERTQEIATRNTELQEVNGKLEQASLTDSLTGLRNRRYLMTEVDKSIALVERFYTTE